MKSVIVGFSSPKTWKVGAEFIKLWQGGAPYSHVYVKIKSDKVARELVYQASHGSVNCISYAVMREQHNTVAEFEYDLEDADFLKFIQYCIDELGKPYGYIGLIRIGLRKLFKIHGDGDNSFHCSEFVLRALPELRLHTDPDFVEPIDLYQALVKNEKVKSVL